MALRAALRKRFVSWETGVSTCTSTQIACSAVIISHATHCRSVHTLVPQHTDDTHLHRCVCLLSVRQVPLFSWHASMQNNKGGNSNAGSPLPATVPTNYAGTNVNQGQTFQPRWCVSLLPVLCRVKLGSFTCILDYADIRPVRLACIDCPVPPTNNAGIKARILAFLFSVCLLSAKSSLAALSVFHLAPCFPPEVRREHRQSLSDLPPMCVHFMHQGSTCRVKAVLLGSCLQAILFIRLALLIN